MQKRADIPDIGLGTYKLLGENCIRIVSKAIELGYRHIDTAFVYENHRDIGKCLKSYQRKDFFLTTKFHLEQLDFSCLESSLRTQCELALEQLCVDYLDLFLIHMPNRSLPMHKALEAMNKLLAQGLVQSIGVSNFTIRHLKETFLDGLRCDCNQVEFHPYLFQKELWDYCKERGISLVAYRPFGKGVLLNDPVIDKIAQEKRKTPGQIILNWLREKKIPTIPKASSETHLRENLEYVPLSKEDVLKLDSLHQNKRFCMADSLEFSY
jgi:2,5-diketo-D-gluconate reductase B